MKHSGPVHYPDYPGKICKEQATPVFDENFHKINVKSSFSKSFVFENYSVRRCVGRALNANTSQMKCFEACVSLAFYADILWARHAIFILARVERRLRDKPKKLVYRALSQCLYERDSSSLIREQWNLITSTNTLRLPQFSNLLLLL